MIHQCVLYTLSTDFTPVNLHVVKHLSGSLPKADVLKFSKANLSVPLKYYRVKVCQ